MDKSATAGKQYSVLNEPPPVITDHIKRKFLNIPYASLSNAQRLDIYLPEKGDSRFPVIIWIHGGAFLGCDKADPQVFPALKGLKRSYAVVSVNYRLSGEARFPAQLYDAKAAVRWIRANAETYHFNPDKIAAWGSSAGAYLALMLGVSAGLEQFECLKMGNQNFSSNVQAVVDWYGPSDFLLMDQQLVESGLPPAIGQEHNSASSPESLLFGREITQIPDRIKAASPIAYISQFSPPFFIQHGTRDAVVPVQQSIELASKLKAIAGDSRVKFDLLQNAEHGGPVFETQENVKKVLDFLDTYLKKII